ncbi:peroxisomal sarcosine oxidase-like [Branchiostoma floridae]|uniref:Peroxisomal sarcosine oxidase n=1 Tax=Branchiostoma floridae TaxID=7739 RepID=A0A9J7M1X0_BRAFL|nr:peroxisomal sarcosine oxidase-like [Branchiostoma floridae]
MAEVWDAVVVGAGIEGSATAFQLAKNGCQTLLVEQFPLPHSRGSSHGASRIIRKAYVQQHYAQMMKEAYPIWEQVQQETGTQLYMKTGGLMVAPSSSQQLDQTERSLAGAGSEFEKLISDDLKLRFPNLSFPADYRAILDPEAGVLKADKALRCFQDLFVKYGGRIRDEEKVVRIDPGDVVTVHTSKSTYKTHRLLLLPGPWAGKLLAPLGLQPPLEPVRISVLYWREKQPDTYALKKGFPVFVDHTIPHKYGLPSLEYPGIYKLCFHSGPVIDPDNRDGVAGSHGNQAIVRMMCDYVRKHFPGLESVPAIQESCMYTNTPDEDFILDRHPQYRNIIIGVGFSGHGFKLAPVVGKLLCELAMDKQPSYDMTPFSLSRFHNTATPQAKL